MLYGIMLIIVLIITGGAIAFIGDRLGTKVGKKRLSLFGLRPRHTSIIITIFTGICITTLTLGVSAAVSQNVRTALFGMERLQQRMTATQQQLDQAASNLSAAQEEQAATDQALRKAKGDVADLREQSAQLQEGNRILQLANEALQANNSSLLADNDRLGSENAQLSGLNDQLNSTNAALSEQNTKLTAGNKQLSTRNDTLTQVNNMLGKRTEELANGLISMREGDIVFRAGEILASGVIHGDQPEEKVRQDMESLMQMASRNISARVGKNQTDQNIWVYKPEYDGAVAEIAKSKKDMVVRVTAAGNLIRGEEVRASLELYNNSTIYQADEFILARRYTLTGKSGEAEQAVMDFLHDINFAALQRGILADPLNGSVGVMEGTQFYDIVQELTKTHGDVVLSAYARSSTDALGPLRLKVKVEGLPSDS